MGDRIAKFAGFVLVVFVKYLSFLVRGLIGRHRRRCRRIIVIGGRNAPIRICFGGGDHRFLPFLICFQLTELAQLVRLGKIVQFLYFVGRVHGSVPGTEGFNQFRRQPIHIKIRAKIIHYLMRMIIDKKGIILFAVAESHAKGLVIKADAHFVETAHGNGDFDGIADELGARGVFGIKQQQRGGAAEPFGIDGTVSVIDVEIVVVPDIEALVIECVDDRQDFIHVVRAILYVNIRVRIVLRKIIVHGTSPLNGIISRYLIHYTMIVFDMSIP